MNKLTSALAAILVIGSASIALADDLSIDQAANAMRNHGPVVSQQAPLTTRSVSLPHNFAAPAIDRAAQTFSGGY